MRATTRRALLVGVSCAAACGGSDVGSSDASPPFDSTGNGPGLVVPFATESPIPGAAKHDVVLSRVLFRLAYLRIIGDAGPGDTRTSRDHFQLEWKDGTNPPSVAFADAPAGLYSKVSIRADGETVAPSYEIVGSVTAKDGVFPFRIHDLEPLEISIDTGVALDPGQTAEVLVRLELDSAFDGINFSDLPLDQGVLDFATDDRQMPKFRNRMRSAFATTRGAP